MKKLFKSPAKVNLFLNVIGEREDGYHLIESLMAKVTLFDNVLISVEKGNLIKVSCPGRPELEGEGNLAFRAARLFLDKLNIETGINIDIRKNIPVGGGLGGGSSNAATVLLGLNEMLKSPLSKDELACLGVKIGSDVPFFIYDGTCLVEGVGEKVTPIKGFPELNLVVLSPDFGISTAGVYKMIKGGLTKSVSNVIKAASAFGNGAVLNFINNDLELFAFKVEPSLARLKESLIANGARKSIVSGSGSSVFGIFENRQDAGRAAKNIVKQAHGPDKCTKNLKIFEVTTAG